MRILQSAVPMDSTTLSSASEQVLRLESSVRPRLPCHLFIPRERHPDGRMIVSVHGVSRNVEEHIELLKPFAESFGVVLLVPLFAEDRFPDYQRLGRKGQGPRADLALIRLLNELKGLLGRDTYCVDMFGFSGGAQFAHRFAMAHPQRVRRLSLGAAGWYTMPDRSLSYPFGVRDANGLDGVRLDVTAAARLTTLVLVGERDNSAEEEELNQSKRVCRRQGANRCARAHSWVQEMNEFASKRGDSPAIRLLLLPGVDHSFNAAVLQGDLGAHVFDHSYKAPDSDRLQPMARQMQHADSPGKGALPIQPGIENR